MAKKGIFPAPDLEFSDFIMVIVPHLTANKIRLKIDDADITQANNLLGEWQTLFPKSQDSAQRTAVITIKKDTLRTAISTLIRMIYGDIPRSRLTISDRLVLGIKQRDTVRTAPQVPASSPKIQPQARGNGTFNLRFHHPDNPASRKKPKGVKFIEIEISVNAVGIDNIITGKILYFLIIDPIHLGKKVSFRARYLNNRGEPGLWSDTVESWVA